jgi:TatD DNase family protein
VLAFTEIPILGAPAYHACMRLFDTHAHLFDDRFRSDLPKVLERAAAEGLVRVLAVGIDLPTSRVCVEQAGRFALLKAAVGIQPNHAAEAGPGDWSEIAKLAEHPAVVAIGETGLDRYWDRAPFALQEELFRKHIQLSRTLNKPFIVHNREADADVLRVLREEIAGGPVPGVMHSFTGTAATARECLDLGLYLSFAGMVTYKSAADLLAVAAAMPEDRLMVETDCPYLSPVPHRGKRNEPAYVAHTLSTIALARGVAPSVLAEASTRNAERLFGTVGE